MGRGTKAATAHRSLTRGAAPASGIGSRVRELRVAAGMTQADLAGERFSKEYVSQVELGKSPPSEAGIEAHRHSQAVAALDAVGGAVSRADDPKLGMRFWLAQGWAVHHLGDLSAPARSPN